jgi:hypothetical protein
MGLHSTATQSSLPGLEIGQNQAGEKEEKKSPT